MEKPENTDVSDAAWEKFKDLAELNGYGEHPDDWLPFFYVFEAGYVARMEE